MSDRKEEYKTYENDKLTISVENQRVRTLEDLIRQYDIDLNLWKVESFSPNSWEVQTKDNGIERLHQLKAVFKYKKDENLIEKLIEHFKDQTKKYKPSIKIEKNKNKTSQDKLFVLNLPDVHLAKLVWAKEIHNGEDYDLKISIEKFKEHVISLSKKVAKSYSGEIEEVLFVIGNDFLNADNHLNTTTAGTQMENDSRWQKIYIEACNVCVETMDFLLQNFPKVKVLMVSGNHDFCSTFYLGEYCKAWFKSTKNIVIDNGVQTRKYYSYYNNLFCITHGNEEKQIDLPLTMATEQPKLWGLCEHKEVFLGHFHTQRLNEIKGVKVRTFPSICPTDSWHSKRAYIGSEKVSQALIYDRNQGLDSIIFYK